MLYIIIDSDNVAKNIQLEGVYVKKVMNMKKIIIVAIISTTLYFFTCPGVTEAAKNKGYAGQGYVGIIISGSFPLIPLVFLSYFPSEYIQMMLPYNPFSLLIPLNKTTYFHLGGLGFGTVEGDMLIAYYINKKYLLYIPIIFILSYLENLITST